MEESLAYKLLSHWICLNVLKLYRFIHVKFRLTLMKNGPLHIIRISGVRLGQPYRTSGLPCYQERS